MNLDRLLKSFKDFSIIPKKFLYHFEAKIRRKRNTHVPRKSINLNSHKKKKKEMKTKKKRWEKKIIK